MTCKIKHRVFQRSSFSLYLASFALVARCSTNVVETHFLGFILHSSAAYYYYLLMVHAPHPFSEMNEWLHALWFHLSSPVSTCECATPRVIPSSPLGPYTYTSTHHQTSISKSTKCTAYVILIIHELFPSHFYEPIVLNWSSILWISLGFHIMKCCHGFLHQLLHRIVNCAKNLVIKQITLIQNICTFFK